METIQRKKYFVTLLTVIFLLSLILSPKVLAETRWSCTDTTSTCQAVSFGVSDHEIRTSAIYVSKGYTIYFDFSNVGPLHGIAFGVYKASTGELVSSTGYAAPEVGNDWGYYTVPESGSYYLRAVCGGNGQNGCKGEGSISAPL